MTLPPRLRPVLACTLLAALPALAQAQIWRCESANGTIEYSNNPSSGRDAKCRPMDLPAITTIPAPKLPGSGGGAQGASGSAAATPSPASFPRVDAASQRTRDADRRRILEDELKKEESRLVDLRAEFNGGSPERRGDERNYQKYLDRVQRLKDDIARTESSVASLRREMAALRD
jgi:hypothetical protein